VYKEVTDESVRLNSTETGEVQSAENGVSSTNQNVAPEDKAEVAEAKAEVSSTQEMEQSKDLSANTSAEKSPESGAPVAEPSAETSQTGGAGSSVDYSRTFRELSEGDVVNGVVVHIDKEGVLVDVGTKSEGIILPNEVSAVPGQTAEEILNVGDRIDVYVLKPEGEDGSPVLSKKRADFEIAWERVQKAYEEGKILTAMVIDRVKGGLAVDLGVRGFVPGSHVGSGNVKNLDRYVGQSLPFKIIELDRDRRKVVLSNKLAIEEERRRQREETIASLKEGQIREGIVRRITDYGAFVDLGGIDGLLHVSEMSWTRITHPSEVVKQGQKIKVMVLKMDLNAGRISLGLRQILPDPWADIEERYSVGQVVKGKISRLVPFGAFIMLEGGIEGIIPNAELSVKRVKKPEEAVSVGQQVEAKIVDIKPEERRITLSIRELQEEAERKEFEAYQASTSSGGLTLGELVGDKLQALVSAFNDEENVESAESTPTESEKATEKLGAEEVKSSQTAQTTGSATVSGEQTSKMNVNSEDEACQPDEETSSCESEKSQE
jgi:4-hydroxy-3-methylbut-2-enyl diphosphate reductase